MDFDKKYLGEDCENDYESVGGDTVFTNVRYLLSASVQLIT